MEQQQLPPDTHVGHIRLQVRDAERELGFYRDLLGFREAGREGAAVMLSASSALPYHVLLSERKDATPRPPRSTGLYHVAIRFPDRRALARVLWRLAAAHYSIGGASDHLVSEAIYLDDPEGNGIELYCDRPAAQWPRENGQIDMTTSPLDVEGLLAELAGDREPWTGVDPRTDIGHVHLQVSGLRRAEAFYHDLLGLDVTQRSYPGALFVSAGGYHHHVGANIWNSRNAAAPPPTAAGRYGSSFLEPGSARRPSLGRADRSAALRRSPARSARLRS